MQKIKFMTDSASDIPVEQEKELDIQIMCFPLTVNEEGYRERVDFTNEEFYEVLNTSPKVPSHAQITQIEFGEAFEEYYKDGYTDVIYVSINSRGSATFSNSVMARDRFFEENPDAKGKFNIHLIDSKSYTIAYGYAVVEGARKARKGIPVDEIVAFIEDWVKNVIIYFATYSLEFAKKSGRVSAVASFMGELLGLRPIMSFPDGKSKVVEKVRGDNAVIPRILDLAEASITPHTPYMLLCGSEVERIDELTKEAEKRLGAKAEGLYRIGAVISINAGPRTVGIVVKGKPSA